MHPSVALSVLLQGPGAPAAAPTRGTFDWSGARRGFMSYQVTAFTFLILGLLAFGWALLCLGFAAGKENGEPLHGSSWEAYLFAWLLLGVLPATGPAAWFARWATNRPFIRGPDPCGGDLDPDLRKVREWADSMVTPPSRYALIAGAGVLASVVLMFVP